MGKGIPSVYRDEPDRDDDNASTSSAVPLARVNFHDEDDNVPEDELPAYEDVPSISPAPYASGFNHPPLPHSSNSREQLTTTTVYPPYSQDASELKSMLQAQAQLPPTWTCRVNGFHTQTTTTADKKTERKTVTDFDVHLDMTHLLVPTTSTDSSLRPPGFTLPDPLRKAYRGHRTKTRSANIASIPSHSDESAPDVDAYIEAYVSNPHPVRSFTLDRQIINHDSALLKRLLTSLVGSTNYHGHLEVSFRSTFHRVTVLSPCWQNNYRSKWWMRLFFYVTFLWLFSWPYLWFVTRRWEVLTKQFMYSCCIENCGNRKFLRQGEEAFFQEWKASLRRAVLEKKQGWIDEEYKLQTEAEVARGAVSGLPQMLLPRTGNTVADGALGFLEQAGVFRGNVAMAGGWGADS